MKSKKKLGYVFLGIFATITLAFQAWNAVPVQAQDGVSSSRQANKVELVPMERTLGEPYVPDKDPGTKSSQPEDPRTPNLRSQTTVPDPIKNRPSEAPPDRGTSWSVLMSETFEGAFPTGLWQTFDNNGSTYGEYFWDDDDFKPRTDYWSAWVANGGANGLDPASNSYPNYMDSWMMYGPFDLSNCSTADFEFYYWNKSESNYDYFGWGASPNGTNVYGSQLSGDQSSWGYVDFSLDAYLGDSSVWLAFIATSDYMITDVGAFVDDVYLWCGHETTTKSWTMMVYLDGDNNLESAAVGDFLEMSSQGSDSNVAILAQMDRIGGYDTSYGDWTDTRRFYITAGMTPSTTDYVGIGEANMGDPDTLLKFIHWAKAKAPANHYVLVMWDHGSGWRYRDPDLLLTKGVAFDDTSGGDAIDSPELRSVLATATSSGAYPIDIVGLDACMMAMAEIDNQIRPYGLIRVSSEETEPNDGWPYDTILAGLKANPSWTRNQLATRIVDDYYTSYAGDQTQSAVDLGTPYTTLNNAIETFANAMINNGNNWIANLYSSRNASTQFSWSYYIDLWDFADWTNINVPDPTINAAAVAVRNAVTAAVIHEHHGTAWPWSRGISIYFPKTSAEYDARYDGDVGFLQFTANTHWDEWIHYYHDFATFPVMFSKSAPGNAATNQPIAGTISWGTSAGATRYDACMDNSNDNACSTGWTNFGTSTSTAYGGLSGNSTYYWQVRAVNSNGSVYANNGTWWSFTTGTLPGAFSKSSPASTTTGVSLSPTLSWGSSTAATSYQYCYDTTNDSACSTWTSTGTATSVGLSGLSQYTTYYWHVRATNSIGTTYANVSPTAFWYFTTGGVPAGFNKAGPSNGSTNVVLNPTLSWASSAGAASYEYCYDTSNDNTCSTWTSTGTATNAGLSGLSVGTTYYWHVRSNNSFGSTYANGSSTAFWSFTTGTFPAAFNKSGPTNGATSVVLNPSLSWESSTGATSYEYCYDTSNDSACSTWTSTGTATSVGLSGLSQYTTYYWHVRATNSIGTTYANVSPTGYWSFTTGGIPGSFNKSGPGNGTTGVSLNPTLTWGASTGNTSFDYCYDTTNDNACSGWISNGNSTSAVLSGLLPGTTYFWQVVANNTFGTRYADGSSTAYWYFTTAALPAAFSKISPVNGATNRPKNLTVTWGASADVDSYEYCIDKTNDNNCSTGWVGVGTNLSAALTGLTSGTHFWQVQARNANGTTMSNGGTWWSFKVPPKPRAFNKTTPVNNSINRPRTLTLYWSASTNAVKYEFCIRKTMTAPCTWKSTGLTRNITLTGLLGNQKYFWQVRAKNANGTTLANGGTWWNFKTKP